MSEKLTDYKISDLMIVRLAKEIKDGEVIHCGAFTQLVLGAGLFAQATHAPNCVILPVSVSCSRTFKPFPMTTSFLETMSLASGQEYRMTDIFTHVEGFDGCSFEPVCPVQVDKYGNINNTVVGSYIKPKIRMPGAAGMDILPIMPNDKLIIYTPRHSKKVFVEKVDFITAAGFLDGPGGRERAGITGNGGPSMVVTDLCVMDFDEETKRMRLVSLHPHVELEEVIENTGFSLIIPEKIATTPPPTKEDIQMIREVVDPFDLARFEFMTAQERRKNMEELIEIEERWLLERVHA